MALHSGGFRGVSEVSTEPPFGLHLLLRSTELEPPFLSGYRTKKTAVVAHLGMLQQKIHSKIDRLNCLGWYIPVVVALKRSKMGVVSNISRARVYMLSTLTCEGILMRCK